MNSFWIDRENRPKLQIIMVLTHFYVAENLLNSIQYTHDWNLAKKKLNSLPNKSANICMSKNLEVLESAKNSKKIRTAQILIDFFKLLYGIWDVF